MEQKTRVLARQLPWSDEPGSLDSICRTLADELGVRITVIAQNGAVIGDSDEPSGQMENHGSRPEAIAALSRGAAPRCVTAPRSNTTFSITPTVKTTAPGNGSCALPCRSAKCRTSRDRWLAPCWLDCCSFSFRTNGGLLFLPPSEQSSQSTG